MRIRNVVVGMGLLALAGTGCTLRLRPMADPFYEAMVRQNADNAAALYAQGQVLVRQGRFAEALPLLEKVTLADGTNPQAWLALGRCNLDLGRWQAARRAFERAGQLRPSAEASLGTGSALVFEGRLTEAQSVVERIRNEYGESAALYRLQGDLAYARREYDRSLELYRKSLSENHSQKDLRQRITDLEEFLTSRP